MYPNVQVHGESGPPVLLLPGGSVTCEGFYPGYVEALVEEPGARVVVHDRPGTGTSPVDGTLAEASSHLHTLVQDLGMGPVVVVGQSLGGTVATLFARDFPEDVAGIVLLDATPFNDVALIKKVERMYTWLAVAARAAPTRYLLRRWMSSEAEKLIAAHGLQPRYADALRANAAVDMRDIARSLRGISAIAEGFREADLPSGIPAAVVSADHKQNATGTSVRAAHQRLADAFGTSVTRWPDASHGLHLEFPAETIEVIRTVVRESTRRR